MTIIVSVTLHVDPAQRDVWPARRLPDASGCGERGARPPATSGTQLVAVAASGEYVCPTYPRS
jgi:hypothetical protein